MRWRKEVHSLRLFFFAFLIFIPSAGLTFHPSPHHPGSCAPPVHLGRKLLRPGERYLATKRLSRPPRLLCTNPVRLIARRNPCAEETTTRCGSSYNKSVHYLIYFLFQTPLFTSGFALDASTPFAKCIHCMISLGLDVVEEEESAPAIKLDVAPPPIQQ